MGLPGWQCVHVPTELNCRFTGLVNFPRDALSCPFEIGGWDYADNVQNLTFMDPGIHLETRQETGGTSYQEYAASPISRVCFFLWHLELRHSLTRFSGV